MHFERDRERERERERDTKSTQTVPPHENLTQTNSYTCETQDVKT